MSEQDQQQQQQAADPAPPKKNSAEARIGFLYGQNKDLTEQLAQASSANEEMRSQLFELQEQVRAMRAGPASPGVPGLDPVVTPSSGNENDALLRELKELKTAVGSITQRDQLIQAQRALEQRQLQSYAEAQAEFTALADRSSELSQAADKIWKSDPILRQHVHGPYLAAHIANSFLGPKIPADQQIERKLAATQLPTASVGPAPSNDKATQLKQLEEQKAKLDELTQINAPNAASAHSQAQKLRVQIAQLKQELAANK